MTPMPLSRIATAAGGRLQGDDAAFVDVFIDAISTDTRTLDAGDGRAVLFVALKGENFDGHDHVAQAASLGARAALVAHEVDVALPPAFPQIIVADTQRALATFANTLQRARKTKVIAITGSNGKTSVKMLALSIMQRAGNTYANPGNRNNEIGLPLAVIDAPDDADCAIYEMGAGKPGDIAYLAAIAQPDVALVNNVAPAHLERMGSLLGIAGTKAAIYDALPADGVAVINADDAFAPLFEQRVFAERAHGRRLIRFGLEASADVTAREIRQGTDGSRFVLVTPQGDADVALALSGRHNVLNALAAASLALGAGVALDAIAAGLNAAKPVAGRLVTYTLGQGVELIDDSYNANPGSLNAAIDALAAASSSQPGGESWLVLGDMRELGHDAVALHAEAGRRAKSAGIARLYALGELSAAAASAFGEGARAYQTHVALADALAADLRSASAASGSSQDNAPLRVLVKGSRGSAMDRIVAALLSGNSSEGGNANAA